MVCNAAASTRSTESRWFSCNSEWEVLGFMCNTCFCVNSVSINCCIRLEVFYPVICCVINDNPEGQLLALVYNSAKAKFPCRTCWVHGHDFCDPDQGNIARLRTVAQDQESRLRLESQADFKGLSLHSTLSGFRNCSFGANKHGIFLAAGPDRMHLMLEGLGKHIVAYTIQKIKAAGVYVCSYDYLFS